MDLDVIPRNAGFMLSGLGLSFQLAAITLLGGVPLGVVLGIARLSRRWGIYYPASLYVHFFRSQPLILIIFWFYFLVPIVVGRPLGAFVSAAIAFVTFEAAYFAEIVRGGIQSVPRGQQAAALASGLRPYQVQLSVVLPQAIRNMVPSLTTQTVIIFQDTSLGYVIGLREFLRRVNLTDSREVRSLELYLFAGLVYFLICFSGSRFSRRFERRREESAH